MGCALDAASRGHTTLLLEQHDFAKGTTSRSTKLIHGGVRYLRQGNIALVLESLRERGILMQNAPHLVTNQSFLVPSYEWWDGPFYGVGMKVYDLLAGKLGIGPSSMITREETLNRIPNLKKEGLRGGVLYHDGQFDDARLAVNLARTAVEHGAALINYLKVTGLVKAGDRVAGVTASDVETGREFRAHGRVVVNATGVFTDSILAMDDPRAKKIITPSQGVHLVLGKEFLPGDTAIMVPHTDDGRVLFAVPWHDKVVVGTTDTYIETPTLEPCALDEEVDFILRHASKYMAKAPRREDVLSVFAGLRPLVSTSGSDETASMARDHFLLISKSGLVTITGGKWTTYRKMAEETIDHAELVAGLDERPCKTKDLPIHGWIEGCDLTDPLCFYGSDAAHIRELIEYHPQLGARLHQELPFIEAEVIWAVREEMARTVEDVLARRTRALLLNARASMEAAPKVAGIMARELGWSANRQEEEAAGYTELARSYVLDRAGEDIS